jgi:hypothetical protein
MHRKCQSALPLRVLLSVLECSQITQLNQSTHLLNLIKSKDLASTLAKLIWDISMLVIMETIETLIMACTAECNQKRLPISLRPFPGVLLP